jgi:DNA-binding transcriptional regulator GbsR (MarR family)
MRRDSVLMSEESFDQEIYVIEDEILNQVTNLPMFFGRDPVFIRLLTLFMTRKYLTQKTLQRITGLSAGKISEEVNLLLEMNLIEKADISKKGKIIYSAESAGLMLYKFSKSIINRMIKWEQDLEEMKIELEENKGLLENEKGYNRIVELNNFFIDTIKKYKKPFVKMDEKLKSSNQP